MQKCEIMLNDLIGSKRTNSNIKATINQLSQTGGSFGIIILVIKNRFGWLGLLFTLFFFCWTYS